jgi:hypothetical protein
VASPFLFTDPPSRPRGYGMWEGLSESSLPRPEGGGGSPPPTPPAKGRAVPRRVVGDDPGLHHR